MLQEESRIEVLAFCQLQELALVCPKFLEGIALGLIGHKVGHDRERLTRDGPAYVEMMKSKILHRNSGWEWRLG